MNSQAAQFSASYLPTKKSQLASQARIAKINELYERRKIEHRDSVVSNNSTSVVSSESDSDQCAPIYGLTHKPPRKSRVEEVTKTIKQENNRLDPIRFKAAVPSTPSPLFREKASIEKADDYIKHENPGERLETDDVYEDNYEEELKFTPKLKSKRSLIISSNLGSGEEVLHHEDLKKLRRGLHGVRRGSRLLSIRKALGDPLPLPYINRDDSSEAGMSTTLSDSDTVLLKDRLDKKKRLMETKWRNFMSPHKSMLDSRTSDNDKDASAQRSNYSFLTSSLPASAAAAATVTATNNLESLELLKDEIVTNREKLDVIIDLLSRKTESKTSGPYPSEYLFWIFCIIILVLLNVFVYYY